MREIFFKKGFRQSTAAGGSNNLVIVTSSLVNIIPQNKIFLVTWFVNPVTASQYCFTDI